VGTRRTVASLAIHPLLGPTLGGTTVQLHGISFEGGDDMRCRFYDAAAQHEHDGGRL
jgi:hypothetical protein